jgi:thioredoxin 1
VKILQEMIRVVTELNSETFRKEVVESKIPVVVDFFASWCGPCNMLAPVFEKVSGDYKGKLKFAKVSTEQYPEIAEQYNVMGIPCLIIFSKGKEADRIVGFNPEAALKQKLDAVLARVNS